MISKKTLTYLLSGLALGLVVVSLLSLSQKSQQVEVMTEKLTQFEMLQELRHERLQLQETITEQQSGINLLLERDEQLVAEINELKKTVRDELNLY